MYLMFLEDSAFTVVEHNIAWSVLSDTAVEALLVVYLAAPVILVLFNYP